MVLILVCLASVGWAQNDVAPAGDAEGPNAELFTRFLQAIRADSTEIGQIERNPVVSREPLAFELCEDFGVEYQAYQLSRETLAGETYADVEIQFFPQTQAEFQQLSHHYGADQSRVSFREGQSYTLTDFLPPRYQAIYAVEQVGLRGLHSNCWGTAYEMRNSSEDVFYSSTFDASELPASNVMFQDILARGQFLGEDPEGSTLQLGDIQFFHRPLDWQGPEWQELAHARSFVACEKNGNHLALEMPSVGTEPRRFVLSSVGWDGTGDFPHWYRIESTNPEFYPSSESREFRDHVFEFRYDQQGRAFLHQGTQSLEEVIFGRADVVPSIILSTLPPSAFRNLSEADLHRAWQVVKDGFTGHRESLDRAQLEILHSTRLWFSTKHQDFFFSVIQGDPVYRDLRQLLFDEGFQAAF